MEIVLVGRSNVGKSSVIKQLTGKRVRIGKRPGVTRKLVRYRCGDLDLVDMPGFGFMAGVPRHVLERSKTKIVRYLEENKSQILFSIEVIDVRLFLEIAERWKKRGQIPIDVEMFSFLRELELDPIIAANKIDVIYREERDSLLDAICEELGLPPPWRQWRDVMAPISAKTGEGMAVLRRLIGERLRKRGKERLLKYFKKHPA
jgi:GTP-binding protein EngB required for normal cell division